MSSSKALEEATQRVIELREKFNALEYAATVCTDMDFYRKVKSQMEEVDDELNFAVCQLRKLQREAKQAA